MWNENDETPRSEELIIVAKRLLVKMKVRGEQDSTEFQYLAEMVNRHDIRKELSIRQ